MLFRIWYSQTHLKLPNSLKGYSVEVTETNPLDNQIDVHYIKLNHLIWNVTSGNVFNRYVLVAYAFFITLHLFTLPFYVLVYASYLLINICRVYAYIQDLKVLELQAYSVFKWFPNQWVELIYNMVYRRVVVAAFVTIYKIAQLVKAPNRRPTSVCGSLNLLFKLLTIILRLMWVPLFQVPW